MGMIQCSCKFDDIVDVACNRLIRCDECRDILHARPHRIDLQIDTPFPRKPDRAVDQPDLAPVALHRKIVNADARERALCTEEEAVKRLVHQLSVRR